MTMVGLPPVQIGTTTGDDQHSTGEDAVSEMTASEFKAAVGRIANNYDKAAAVLGIGRRTLIRYAVKGDVPEPVRRLLVMLDKHGVPREFRRHNGQTTP